MREFDKLSSLSLHNNDKLTEESNAMLEEQYNKSECIHTMLKDFVKVNGIVIDYTSIPEKERLEKFFRYSAYSGEPAYAFEPGKRGGRHCPFIFSLYNDLPDWLEHDVLVMLDKQDSRSDFIRNFFLDFVRANGVVANYAGIPEKERLEQFFGYVTEAVAPAKKPA